MVTSSCHIMRLLHKFNWHPHQKISSISTTSQSLHTTSLFKSKKAQSSSFPKHQLLKQNGKQAALAKIAIKNNSFAIGKKFFHCFTLKIPPFYMHATINYQTTNLCAGLLHNQTFREIKCVLLFLLLVSSRVRASQSFKHLMLHIFTKAIILFFQFFAYELQPKPSIIPPTFEPGNVVRTQLQ